MKYKILIIDDEPQIRKILRITLEAEGYSVIEAENGTDGLARAATEVPDVTLLDLGLPIMDGLAVLREIRSWSELPVIIVSVRNADEDIVEALDAGANDYVVKPFNVKVLLARLRAVIRKTVVPETPVFTVRQLAVDFASRSVTLAGVPIKLTNTEYHLLSLFIKNRGRVLTHRYVLQQVWGNQYADQTQNLRVFIGQLRKKIDAPEAADSLIMTESGVGYRFVAGEEIKE